MNKHVREHSRGAAASVNAWADEARQTIGRHLQALQGNEVLTAFVGMDLTERRQMIEELRAAFTAWTESIEPLGRQLRALLRDLQDVAWEADRSHMLEEDQMPWTQRYRDLHQGD